ncbi:hypothetical protein [Mycetocola manganoxydans]|uniref:hypothetical protein n=1 Tax=Mycetocola manganoxydans TaxID=699879 RepID=UPI001603176A|nr:hypothetical protein [Mycetocola manganoxydans]GHD48818.1 hypothetical protein GCM10008097_21220 [Mycetocola manganoxydans]
MIDHTPPAGDPRHPGDAFLQAEIDENRAGERALVPKTVIAIAFVVLLVVVRELFFA